MPQHFSDDEIIAKLCSKDPNEQKKILLYLDKHWKPMAYSIVVNLGGGDESQAEGAYDEAIIALIRLVCKEKKYDPKKSRLSTLFFSILRRKWWKFWRDKIRREQKAKDTEAGHSHNPGPSAEEEMIRREERKAAADILENGMDEICRKIIKGYLVDGKSLKIISEELGLSYDATKKRSERCKKKFREQWKNRWL